MALPNFFYKTALGATQLLRGVDTKLLAEILNRAHVGLLFDSTAVTSPEGRAILELSTSLLARLFPRLIIVPYGCSGDGFAELLSNQARAINPEIEILSDPTPLGTSFIVVGSPPIREPGRPVYIGSNGWLASLSCTAPVTVGNTENPFGAGAAACFGVANIFRIVFGEMLPDGAPDENFNFSMLDCSTEPSGSSTSTFKLHHIGEAHLVGLGAIGNGTIWALSRLMGLRGVLHLVDAESVDLSNLQRYILAQQADINTIKVQLAARVLEHTELKVHPHRLRWGQYLRERDTWQFDRVAVALDSAEDRRAVQAALPRWIANAWTRAENLGVSRHSFDDDQACLTCLYFPERTSKSEAQLVAEQIGLPAEELEVRSLLALGTPLKRSFIEQIAVAKRVPLQPLLDFEGEPLRTFYGRAICGGLLLQLGGTQDQSPATEVPMAFQSAMAGIMLAAEIVTHAQGLRPREYPAVSRINLLRPLPPYLNFRENKNRSVRCICADPDYVTRYRTKYNVRLALSS